ncbi:MAG TPA: hypothetical protein VD993_20790 [Chitinophagaceae bacterium]|nr:hypothetical protein [Chitinophagaceae bacterium]
MRVTRDYTTLIECGKQNELDQNIEEAIQCYKEAIALKPFDELPFTRLMILYRKEKRYEDELKVIDKAIEVFKSFYDKKTRKFSRDNKLGEISRMLLKNLNKGNKGLDEYPEPLPKWTKRKALVEEKLGKQTDKKKKAKRAHQR